MNDLRDMLNRIPAGLQTIVTDLREKRLWPIALGLLIALVALPIALHKSAPSITPPSAVPAGAGASSSGIPALAMADASQHTNLAGPSRDPFPQTSTTAMTGVKTTTPTAATTSVSSSSGSTGSTGSSAGPLPTTTTPTTSTPAGASPTVTFFTVAVDLAFGPVGKAAPHILNVERLTPFPSAANPVLVFLGVKADRKTAVFLLSSLAAPAGQGTCVPSARQCEFLDMTSGQRELLLVRDATGGLTEYKLGVLGVHLQSTGSSATARHAYMQQSKQGAAIIKAATPYSPALQSLTYSADTGTLSIHPLSPAAIKRLRTAGVTSTGVVLHPVRRP